MPIYEYECEDCGHHCEVIQKFNDVPLSACPACSGTMHKLVSQTSFILKGSGWYATDYASPERKKARESDHPGSKNKEKIDTKAGNKAETETASRAEAASKS